MAIQLKPFDQYVEEGAREPIELPMPDGAPPIVFTFPDGKTLKAFQLALGRADMYGAFLALLGPDEGARLLVLYDKAPADTLAKIIGDITTAWGGLQTLPGGLTG